MSLNEGDSHELTPVVKIPNDNSVPVVQNSSKGPTIIGKTYLPEGVRGVNDIMSLVKGAVQDILSQTKPGLPKPEPMIIDVEARIIPEEAPKISD